MDNSVSLIIPTYNRLESLKETLPLYLSLNGLKEIIIVDDASSDETEVYIKALDSKHPFLKYIKHACRRNLPAARNTGIAIATGDYVVFGEDDVVFRPDYLKQLMECMAKTGADIIAGRLIETYKGQDIQFAIDLANEDVSPLVNTRYIFGMFWINLPDDVESPIGVHACALIKREVFERVRYDEAYIGNANREETDFYITAIKEGFRVYYCSHTLAYHLKPLEGKGSSGGCWPNSYLKYGYFFLRNNSLFLRKHLSFLRKTLGIEDSILLIQARFFFHVLARFVLQNYFRQTLPNFYQKILRTFYKIRKEVKESFNERV